MKFLFIEHHPCFGGPHNRAIQLAEPLRKCGWDTIAVLPTESGTAVARLQQAGVPVVQLPLHRLRRHLRYLPGFVSGLVSDTAHIRSLILRERPDLVVVSGLESPQGAIAGHLAEVPVVWQVNGTQTPMSYRRAIAPVVRRCADVVMTTGTTIAREYPGLTALGRRWIPFFSPVDVNYFRPDQQQSLAARAELGIDADACVIGAIGNVNPQKGYDTFIAAAARLRRRHPCVRFVILGASDPNHTALQEELWRSATRLGLTLGDDLVVCDAGSRVAELASGFDILWCSSVPRSEGVSTGVMEGMALGLPVVATDVGGMQDIVADGHSGFLVPPLDERALAEASEALVVDAKLRSSMGAAGRTFIVSHAQIERCVEAHLQAFEVAWHHAAR